MRKVEATMNSMIRNGIAWSDGNTCTTYDQKGNCLVYLHGNHIATVGDSFMAIFDGGYQSTTTKSRLNALCDAFCVDGERVFQKNFAWYVRVFTGAVNGKNVYINKPFANGYTFA